MATLKGDTVSRVRRLIKGLKSDAFITDRFLYSMVLKYAKLFIKRKDDSNKLGRYNSLFEKFPGVSLKEVSKIEAGCIDIPTCCSFKRTVDKLPPILEGSFGPIIRDVTSIDGSIGMTRTYAKVYREMTKTSSFKYNKTQYYWLSNGYAYFPNLEWDNVDIEAMWENDISEFLCNANCCLNRQLEETHIPEDLFVEIEGNVQKELFGMLQIPSDSKNDNQSIQKS